MSEKAKQRVAIIGASLNEERYAHKAQRMLMDHGYPVAPVSPSASEVLGVACWKSLSAVPGDIDTVTLYVAPYRLDGVMPSIREKRPKRVIFNPGTESPAHQEALAREGIEVVEACTLVLLSSGQF